MTTRNEDVNDVNSPVQTQESEMGDAELQVVTSRVDAGEKSDELSTNVAATFSCDCYATPHNWSNTVVILLPH